MMKLVDQWKKELPFLRKIIILILCFISIFLCYFTYLSAEKVFRSDWALPHASGQKQNHYRIVLITKDLDTPFWDKVAIGARNQAEKDGAGLEVWGSYGNNHEEFLKKIEIALQSKVDGIIVQGLDTEEFKQLAKVKAAFYGIPIITVANDVPKAESLRKTYVGSDHYFAGKLIAEQLLKDMGTSGEVIVLYDSQEEYDQMQRLKGIEEVLRDYPDIRVLKAATPNSREHAMETTKNMMNSYPGVDGFIAVNANIAGPMTQEIERRSRVEPFHIYTFDDGPESLSLLMKGKLDGMVEQSPAMMGERSVDLMIDWLDGKKVPLNMDGYLTEVRILKAKDVQ